LLGFPYAVVKKYIEDAAGRQAALLTYYGFLSIFPLLLVAVSVLSNVLVNRPEFRQELIEAVVPPGLQETVNDAVTATPSSVSVRPGSSVSFVSTGVVLGVPGAQTTPPACRCGRGTGPVQRYVGLRHGVCGAGCRAAAGTLAVASGCSPTSPVCAQAAAARHGAVVSMLTVAAKILIARPVPWRACWPAAALGAVMVSLVLALGTRLLAVLVTRSGPVYGSFASVVGVFTLFYLTSQALLYAAEVVVVRQARLWPRALDTTNPTPADVRALTRLAVEQERLPAQRVEVHFPTADPPRDDPPA
jgi:uncharacterized BrkB/YihY/UPF0761 family membrane protein